MQVCSAAVSLVFFFFRYKSYIYECCKVVAPLKNNRIYINNITIKILLRIAHRVL